MPEPDSKHAHWASKKVITCKGWKNKLNDTMRDQSENLEGETLQRTVGLFSSISQYQEKMNRQAKAMITIYNMGYWFR